MAIGEQAGKGDRDELLSFAPLEGGNGVEIVDHIERRQFSIRTSRPAEPQETPTAQFEFPVSKAITIETERLEISNQFNVVLRNSLGFMVSEIVKGEEKTFPHDGYSLDPGAPVKTYIRFEAPFSISISSDGIQIQFPSSTVVHIGIRSRHKRPAATITTTEDITDAMEAISYFSSALKTTSCERSYPTLRGHPPTIELGETLSIPSHLERKETGVSIEVPPKCAYVYTISTLAYYLGAEVVPGDQPRLLTDQGLTHSLTDAKKGFGDEVERVLKKIFFLDCITRTEGLFQVNLHERDQIEDAVDLDFVQLYNASLQEQLEAYLEVPYHVIEPELPKWKLRAKITPDIRYVETLPFLVNDLAIIETTSNEGIRNHSSASPQIEDFVRGGERLDPPASRSSIESAQAPSLVRIEESESMEQAWIGEGAPIGASKAIIEAFRNRLGRTPTDGDIDITVVCNAAEMGQERDLVNEVYASRDDLPFEISIYRELTTDEFETLLAKDIDFLHYIGHIDAAGFECRDGRLDAASLDHTGVDVFFLNACTSYEQGRNLIEAGSIAGVVTLQDIINSGAQRVGMMLARLLNWGFPLRPAMNLAQQESIMGGHYLVIGDGSIDIAQPRVGIQGLCDITRMEDEWGLQFHSYPTRDREMGAIVTPYINNCNEYFLISGSTTRYRLNEEELTEYLSLEEMPIRYQGETTWSSEFLSELD